MQKAGTFRNLKIFTILSVGILTCLNYIHRNQGRYNMFRENHSYLTRNKNDIILPIHSVKRTQESVDYRAINFTIVGLAKLNYYLFNLKFNHKVVFFWTIFL